MTPGPLAYVTAIVADPDAAASALERALQLPRQTVDAGGAPRPLLPIGAAALLFAAPGDAFVGGDSRPGVHHIALAASNLESTATSLVAAGLIGADHKHDPGLDGRRRIIVAADRCAGVATHVTEPLRLASASGSLVERFDHIGIASADNAVAQDVFCRRLGYALESTQTDMEVHIAVESFTSDKYGAIYKTREPETAGGLRVAFITVGDCELEFLQDITPQRASIVDHGGPGTTRQDKGAIGRYVATRGPGLHHVALKVADGQAALDSLAAAGLALIDRVPRPGSRRALIGFVHPKSLGGLLLHVVQR